MKQSFLLCLMAVLTGIGHLYSQQWYTSYIPHGRNVADMAIQSKTDIQVVGGNLYNDSMESIFRSNDAGVSWDFIADFSGSSWLQSITYADQQTGIAVGTNGKIKRTVNGGTTWAYVASPVNADFSKVIFKTGHQAIAVGGKDTDHSRSIVKSDDGGQTWSVLLHQSGARLNSVAFTDSLHAIVVGDSGTILQTFDGGTNWAPVNSPVLWHLNEVKFVNADTGIIIGGIQYTNARRTILRTTDGGNNWTVIKDESGAWLNDMSFVNEYTGYVVGDSGTIYKTTDAGLTWLPQSIPGSTAFENFNAVNFAASDFGMVATYGHLYVFCNPPVPEVHTRGATFAGNNMGSFLGEINTFDFPADYDFIYDTTPAFLTPHFNLYPPHINTDTLRLITTDFYDLSPSTTYYYFLRATNLAHTVNGDTLSITGNAIPYIFQTDWATNITDTSATLQGSALNLPGVTSVYFEYSTAPDLSNAVTTTPVLINDLQQHTITANLGNLTPYQSYYFRFRGVSGTQLYVGATRMFFVGTLLDSLKTLGATNATTASATLNASVRGCRFPTTLYFEYGTGTQLGDTITASPALITDTGLHFVTAQLNGLQPYTTYYYRIKANALAGDVTGDMLTFSSGILFSGYQTQAATAIMYNSAQINGYVQGAQAATTASFEYGPTSSLGNQIAATPAAVNDTQYHTFSAVLNGLNANTVYYYRLKLETAGQIRYGDIRQLYTGNSAVPNWDFQDWQTDSIELALGWNIVSRNMAKVPGHQGYGLKLSGSNYTLLGMLGDQFIGGQAITGHPDSLAVYLNYFVDPGDTATVGVWMNRGDSAVVRDFYQVTGNSANTFQRFTFPIHYLSALQPDSVTIGFVTTNINPEITDHPNNYLIIDDVSFVPATDPVYNGDFETWNKLVLETPISWSGPPLLFNDSIALLDLPFKKVIHHAPDDYAAEVSTMVYHNHFFSVDLSNVNKMLGSGGSSPIFTKPQTLNGYCRYFPCAGDSAQFSVTLYDHGQSVGYGNLYITDTIPDFTPFEIPIYYANPAVVPDSAEFGFRNSILTAPTGVSRLAIDKLNFDGLLSTAVPEIQWEPSATTDGVNIYPVPSHNYVVVDWERSATARFDVEVLDLNGTVVLKAPPAEAAKRVVLNTENLPSGFYLVRMSSREKTINRKIVIVK